MGLETAAIVGLATAAASLAGTGVQAGLAATADKPKAPTLPTNDPAKEQSLLAAADEKTRRQAASASGRSSTILTSPLGADDGTKPKSTLLGY